MLWKEKEQKADSYDKEHGELFLTLVILTARYLNEKYETPSVKIRQMFDTTTKTKTKRLCYEQSTNSQRKFRSILVTNEWTQWPL